MNLDEISYIKWCGQHLASEYFVNFPQSYCLCLATKKKKKKKKKKNPLISWEWLNGFGWNFIYQMILTISCLWLLLGIFINFLQNYCLCLPTKIVFLWYHENELMDLYEAPYNKSYCTVAGIMRCLRCFYWKSISGSLMRPISWNYPAGMQHWNNVDSTLIQRLDVESTLTRRCFNVVCPLDS